MSRRSHLPRVDPDQFQTDSQIGREKMHEVDVEPDELALRVLECPWEPVGWIAHPQRAADLNRRQPIAGARARQLLDPRGVAQSRRHPIDGEVHIP
jgi:hypothetical protein